MKLIWLWVCLLPGFLPLRLLAQDAALPSLEADETSFDADRGVLVASGRVLLSSGDLRLEADHVEIDQKGPTAHALGNVRLTRGAFRVVASRASYNWVTGEITTGQARLGRYPYYAEASKILGTIDDLRLSEATVYLYAPSASGVRVTAETIQLHHQALLIFEQAVLHAGPLPILPLERFEQRIDEPFPLQYQGNAGFRGDLGAYWQNEVRWRIGPNGNVGANLDGYTERGVLVGPVAELNLPEDGPLRLSAEMTSGGLYDFGSDGRRGDDLAGVAIDRWRYFLDAQAIGGTSRTDLVGVLHWWSDSEVLRDFRHAHFRESPYPSSFVDGTWSGENLAVNAVVQGGLVDGVTATQRLPAVQVGWLPTPVADTNVIFESFGSYANLREEDVTARDQPTFEANRFEAYGGLRYVWHLADGLWMTPRVGGLLSYYAQVEPAHHDIARAVGEIGLDLEASATGTFAWRSEIWGIDGLRHQIAPRLAYRYLPGAHAESADLPPIERPAAFEIYPETLDLARRRDRDALGSLHVIRAELRQVLETRDVDYGSRELASLELLQDIRLDPRDADTFARLDGREPSSEAVWSNLYARMAANPAPWFEARLTGRWDWHDARLAALESRLTVRDGDVWDLSGGNVFVADFTSARDIHAYFAEANYRLNQSHALGATWFVDAERGRLSEQRYAYRWRLDRAWEFELRLTARRGDERASDFSLGLRARLLTY